VVRDTFWGESMTARAALVTISVSLLFLACHRSEDRIDLTPWPIHRPANVQRSALQIRLVLEAPESNGQTLRSPDGVDLHLASESIVSEADIERTEVGRDLYPPHYVTYIHFTQPAAERLRTVTRSHIGGHLAIVVGGKILLAPKITSEVGPTAMIQGEYTRDEATRLAERLAP
jgi:preprotein translocase subunit SecD